MLPTTTAETAQCFRCGGTGGIVTRRTMDPRDLEYVTCKICGGFGELHGRGVVPPYYIVQLANVHDEQLAEYRTTASLDSIAQDAKSWFDHTVSGRVIAIDPDAQVFDGSRTNSVWSISVYRPDYTCVCVF